MGKPQIETFNDIGVDLPSSPAALDWAGQTNLRIGELTNMGFHGVYVFAFARQTNPLDKLRERCINLNTGPLLAKRLAIEVHQDKPRLRSEGQANWLPLPVWMFDIASAHVKGDITVFARPGKHVRTGIAVRHAALTKDGMLKEDFANIAGRDIHRGLNQALAIGVYDFGAGLGCDAGGQRCEHVV